MSFNEYAKPASTQRKCVVGRFLASDHPEAPVVAQAFADGMMPAAIHRGTRDGLGMPWAYSTIARHSRGECSCQTS